jgi:hypothetical protein
MIGTTRSLLSLGLLAALAACTAVAPDPFLTTQAVKPEAPTIASDVSADFAAAYLPTLAGGIQSVRQSVANNSLKQDIVYANQTSLAGENLLTIEVGPPETADFLRPPSQARVMREMRAALPGLDPAISPVVGDNVNGAYGYATAVAGKGSCIYAWQYIKQVTPADSTGIDKFTRRRLAANLRLRYCHPSIPAERIHVLMDGLRVKDINSRTIDMLRFAAGSAGVARPDAVVTPEPVVKKSKIVRQAAVNDDEDWRARPKDDVSKDRSNPGFIDNAATVPLPSGTSDQPVTVPVGDEAKARRTPTIPDAAEIPLPE